MPWIRTPAELLAFVRGLAGASALALDSESDSLHHHVEKVCLLQVATEAADLRLVDPLALRDLSPLAPIMADPAVVKVLHGADYDVTTLRRDFGFTFAGLFDTMIAARFLGFPEVGLVAVAKRELGAQLSKESQKDDWSRRPLTPAQERYALDDVRHLLELHLRLRDQLREKGRLSWVLEECEAVAALPPSSRLRDPEGWQRVKGIRRLTQRQQALLREVWSWRERLAEKTDVPAFKLLSSDAMVTMANQPPRDEAELLASRLLPSRLRSEARAVVQALARAQALPDSHLPQLPPAPPRPVVSADTQRRIATLRNWRAKQAIDLLLDVSVVLPQRLLEQVAERNPAHPEDLAAVPGIRRWRIEAFGPSIVEALRKG